jgi:hypothetical protein
VSQLYPRALWSLLSPLTTRRDYGGGILTRLHTGLYFLFGNPSQYFLTKKSACSISPSLPSPPVEIYSVLIGSLELWFPSPTCCGNEVASYIICLRVFCMYLYIVLRYLWICINLLSKCIQWEWLRQRLVSRHRGRLTPVCKQAEVSCHKPHERLHIETNVFQLDGNVTTSWGLGKVKLNIIFGNNARFRKKEQRKMLGNISIYIKM